MDDDNEDAFLSTAYLLAYYAENSVNSLSTFRNKLSVPFQGSRLWSLKMGPIGCPETSLMITTALCVITQKSVVLIYFVAEFRSNAGDRNLVPRCGNRLRFYWDSAEKPCDGQCILPELYP